MQQPLGLGKAWSLARATAPGVGDVPLEPLGVRKDPRHEVRLCPWLLAARWAATGRSRGRCTGSEAQRPTPEREGKPPPSPNCPLSLWERVGVRARPRRSHANFRFSLLQAVKTTRVVLQDLLGDLGRNLADL